jgi:RimJ/RimL family protein N-acetyltransferase
MSIFPSDEFLWEILENWANHFHCPVNTLQQPGATLLPAEKYAGDKVIALWQIAHRTFVEHDPAYSGALERVLAGRGATARLEAVDLVRSWGGKAFSGHDVNLIHYLYPPDLPAREPPAPLELRQLTLADAAAMDALHEANTAEDVDDGYVEVTHEVAFGCFHGELLAAASSGYRRAGFMDIGVLTHPGFRERGLGKAVAGALCVWCAEHRVIAQYRCNTTNKASHALAKALNFRLFFHSESLWLVD